MGCCCGRQVSDGDHGKEGMVEERRCRDVLFLLLFIAYLGGMFAAAGVAFEKGDPRRLVYALDSRGLLCGANNTYRNGSVDLTGARNLYYLNALELLDAASLPYAKAVCVDACPSEFHRCRLGDLPCTAAAQYRCPYYRFADRGLHGKLDAAATAAAGAPAIAAADTQYYGALANATGVACDAAALAAAVAAVPALAAIADPAVCAAAGPGAAGAFLQAASQLPGEGPCYPVWAATAPFLHRCFPKVPDELAGAAASAASGAAGLAASAAGGLAGGLPGAGGRLAMYVADITKGAAIILAAGLGGGAALSLIWMGALRWFAGAFAWATVAAVNFALAGCTLYAYYLSGRLAAAGGFGAAAAAQFAGLGAGQNPVLLSREHWGYVAFALTAVTGVVLLLTLVMLRRVAVAVACVKVASQAVAAMPALFAFPLLPFILEVGLVVYWVAVAAIFYSAGTPTAHWRPAGEVAALPGLPQLLSGGGGGGGGVRQVPPPPDTTGMAPEDVLDLCAASRDCYISYDWDARLKYAFLVHLFGLLWGTQFIVGFACVVVAGAVASFYWARGERDRMPRFPVARALRRAATFHLGSVALGSFILALVQFGRLMLEYLDKKTRRAQQESKVAQWLMCFVRAAAWLLEKIVAFINRNAYVLVAVKGRGYCASAARGVQLVVANALRLAAVNVVGDALLFLGKLAVAAACGLGAFGLASLPMYNDAAAHPATALSSAIAPVGLAAVVGFAVAQIFFSVYEMAIDTILLSFCEDAEAHGGHPQFAPPLLLAAIGEAPGGGDRGNEVEIIARGGGGRKGRGVGPIVG